MIIYTMEPTTPETRRYKTVVFIDTISGVFVESPGDGFYKHPTFTSETLKKHLDRLKKEGFKIHKKTACARVES